MLKIKVRRMNGIRKYLGLMFGTSKTIPLLFEFKYNRKINIHSWFVFFPFLALWLDKNNKVLEAKVMKPFTTHNQQQEAMKLIEIPLGKLCINNSRT